MFKSSCFAVIAACLFAVSARAGDDVLGGKIDLKSVRDADNSVVESNFNLNVGTLAQKTADKNEQAVEVCCRSWGCYNRCCYQPSYSCCYSSCYYPSYNYCYSSCYCPTYTYYYTPCYTYTYCPSYTYSCSYTPSYSYCCTPSYSCCNSYSWGCY